MEKFKSILCTTGVLSLLIFSGCSEDKDPVPTSQSVFSQDRKIVEVNEKVTFANSSTNAAKYEWDFGNGTTSTAKDASVTYTTPGTYTVKLTSYNSENKTNVASAVVKVGEVYLTSIKVNSVLAYDPSDNSPWDSGSGPDLLFKFGRTANTAAWDYTTTVANNATTFPVTFDFSTNNIKLTNESWDFQLEDYDSPDPNDIMQAWAGNPTHSTDKDFNSGKGKMKLTAPGFDVDLNYEVR